MTDAYPEDHLHKTTEEVRRGGAQKYHDAAAKQGKLFCRERLAMLLDEGSFVEDALLANVQAGDLRPTASSPASAALPGAPSA
jgi:acetyl-CoA carboxylase carboxyltransferase component